MERESLELKIPQGLMRQAIVAVILVVVAIFLRMWPLRSMGTSLAYITFFPAVTIAAIYGGRTSGVIATVLSVIYVYFWQSTRNPNFANMVNWDGMVIFTITGILLSGVSEAIFCARAGEAQAMELAMLEKQHAGQAKLAQLKLADSERRFRNLFENSPTGMVAVDPVSLHFMQANLNAQRLFGYSGSELRDLSVTDLTHPDDLAETMRYNEQLAKGLIDSHFVEKRYLRKDGSSFWAEASISMLKGDDGKAELFICSFIDITHRKETEVALSDSENTYRSLFENMLNGFAYCKMLFEDGKPQDFIYLNVNYAFETLTGLVDVVGKKVSEVIPGIRENDPDLFEVYGRVVVTGIPEKCEIYVESLQKWFSIAVYRPQPGHFVALFEVITERKFTEEKIANYVKQLESAMRGTLQAVSNMVELRDPYTSGHERRVGIIAADIAREMGWSDDRCENLKLIGLVHDIGKIAIPAEILSKPSRLTALEFEMIKNHAQMGYEILKDVEFSLPIAEIIREHHERMDGSGYPRGLKGDEILPEARIIAVADVLESMSSHRPYRPGLGIDNALKEIVDHRATFFDALVVDATLRLIHEKGYQLPS
jgi:PAS domain S-box-containing protein/putative nucleotidyltransferase with HDIG domain